LIRQACFRAKGLDIKGKPFDDKPALAASWLCKWEYWADFWYYECNNNGLLGESREPEEADY
jgi:hypothetical protein